MATSQLDWKGSLADLERSAFGKPDTDRSTVEPLRPFRRGSLALELTQEDRLLVEKSVYVSEPPRAQASRCDYDRHGLTAALHKVAQGDQRAFQFVYEATYAKMMSVCIGLLRDRATAEDVLQNVYIKVWLKAHMFDGSLASPITWITVIARNRALDELRSARRWKINEPSEDGPEFVDPAALASDTLQRKEEILRLKKLVDELPTHERSAVTAALTGDLTYQQLADRENVPCGTMKSWIRRGIVKLKTGMIDPPMSVEYRADRPEYADPVNDVVAVTAPPRRVQTQYCRGVARTEKQSASLSRAII